MVDSKKILVKDESGEEREMEILFTFEDDRLGNNYVLFTDPNDEDGEVFACRYNEEYEMIPVDDEEEWAMIEEVFNTFVEEIDTFDDEE